MPPRMGQQQELQAVSRQMESAARIGLGPDVCPAHTAGKCTGACLRPNCHYR